MTICVKTIIVVIGIILAIARYFIYFSNKKKDAVDLSILKTSEYSNLVFNSKISKVCKSKIREVLINTYGMKKNEEELLHKYLTLFWGVEAALMLIFSQLLVSIKIPILPIILLASMFISFVGLVFSINYLCIINSSNSIILSLKYHIVFLENYLNRNISNIFLGNKSTTDFQNPLLKLYKSLGGLVMLWEVSIAFQLTFLITTGRFKILHTDDIFIQCMIIIIFLISIDIAKYIKRSNNMKDYEKIRISERIYAIKIDKSLSDNYNKTNNNT